jgi:hypothetical protein
MAAAIVTDGDKTKVIGRGFLHSSPVDRSHLFTGELQSSDSVAISGRPYLQASASLAVEDPTIATHSGWFGGEPTVLYSRVVRSTGAVVSDIWMSPLSNPFDRRPLIVTKNLSWYPVRIDMVKEPEVLGDHVFYEFCAGVSRLAVADIGPDGSLANHRLFMDVRGGFWDSEHVSCGPILPLGGRRALMLYNGRSQNVWSIGAVVFDMGTLQILDRLPEPLIRPGKKRGPAGQRIAFASAVNRVGDAWDLYYHEADREIRVARVSVN